MIVVRLKFYLGKMRKKKMFFYIDIFNVEFFMGILNK